MRPALIRARIALRPVWIVETLGRSLLVVVFEVGGQPVLQLTHRAITDRCGFCPIPVGGGSPQVPQHDPTPPPESSLHRSKIIPLFSHAQIKIVQNDRTDVERRGDDGQQIRDCTNWNRYSMTGQRPALRQPLRNTPTLRPDRRPIP